MTRPVFEYMPERDIAGLAYRTRQLARRPGQRPGGNAIFEIKVDEDDVVVTAGDGRFKFDIPSDLDEAALVDVEAWITGESSSGDVVVSFYNNTQGHDMLSTPVTIDVGDLNDKDSGTPFVINLANADVAEGDEIWVNVDNAGTGALGLGVKVAFTPALTAAIVLRAEKGDPGGMTSFVGAWQDDTDYNAGDIVTHGGAIYIALQDHHSNAANDEPGVGTNWTDFWTPLVTIDLAAAANIGVFSSAGPIPDAVLFAGVVPFDATIVSATMLADVATNAVIDVWKVTFGGYPPSSGDSITGGTPPTLTGSIKNIDTTLAGWTTTITANDILAFYVSGVTLARRLTLALGLEK